MFVYCLPISCACHFCSTVFAPTDEAFDNLPDDLVGCLLNDIPVLTDILLYHVAEGKVLASQLSDGQEISTLLDGGEVTVDLRSNGDVLINDAMVLTTDVKASNGVVHVINQVLVPPRIDVTAFLDACTGGGSSSSSDDRDECTYLGVARSAGQYLTGPTHTCLCTTGGTYGIPTLIILIHFVYFKAYNCLVDFCTNRFSSSSY